MRTLLSFALVFLAASAVACSGSTHPESADGGDGGSPGTPCPASIPADKIACTTPGLDCEYGGTGDHLQCSTIASCRPSASGGAQWHVSAPSADCVTSPANNPIGCPPSFATLPTGSACPREAVGNCVYPEGTCGCIGCISDGGAPATQWECDAWPKPSGCPEPRPRVGSACSSEGLSCDYVAVCGVENDQPFMACQNGRWALKPFGAECGVLLCGH